ncbi:MAG: YggS family pyridoxal phosphate-dependent enzyme [Candidatus Sericytochromatia bacterium]|nr:YggS family pyridoxal phosphate-dependent enzyme [Candidatus Sericytochromatia bacterium]
MTETAQRLAALETRIAAACLRAGRPREAVQLVLVSKTVALETLLAAHTAGARIFGENKAQELKQKASQWPASAAAPEWHFIGHLQSNKIKDVLPWIRLLHSLDRPSLAEKLSQALQQRGQTLPVLVQVNTSAESSKSGVPPAEALGFMQQVSQLPGLSLQGLMTIGPLGTDEATTRQCFRQLRQLQQAGREALNLPLNSLSMGMSGDFEWAIEEGATLIRVGSAVFGPRQP